MLFYFRESVVHSGLSLDPDLDGRQTDRQIWIWTLIRTPYFGYWLLARDMPILHAATCPLSNSFCKLIRTNR